MKKLLRSALLLCIMTTSNLMARPAQAAATPGVEEWIFGDIPVVFIASKAEEKPDLAPSVVSVISAEEIERSGVRTISEALQRVPGFYPTRQFFHDDVLGARGYNYHTNDHVVLLLDGHNISRSGWTNFMTGDIDELMSLDKVARIEVIHGPGSLVWGENAMIAVINVVTKKPADVDGADVSYTYGKFGDSGGGISRTVSVLYGKDWGDDTSLMWQISAPTVDGWSSKNYASWFRETVFPSARVDNFNDKFQSYEFWAKAKLHEWNMSFRAMNAHQNIASFQFAVVGSTIAAPKTWEDQLDYSPQVYSMVLSRQYKPILNSTLDVEMAFDKYHFEGRGFGFGGQATAGQGTFAFADMTQDSNAADFNLNFNYTGIERHTILAGAQYVMMQFGTAQIVPRNLNNIYYQLASGTTTTVDIWKPGTDNSLMGYAQDTWAVLDQLNVVYGARAEWNEPRGNSKTVFNPRGGLIFHTDQDKFVLKYLYNQGYRRPTQWESQWGPGLFGTDYSLAHAPEYSYNHDLQAILTAGRTKTTLTLWREKIQGVINAGPNPDGSLTKVWQNSGDFFSDGVEWETTVRLSRDSRLGANATWNRTAVLKVFPGFADNISGANADNRYLDYPEIQGTLFADIALTSRYSMNAAWRYMTEIPGREQTDSNGVLLPNVVAGDSSTGNDVVVRNISYLDLAVNARSLWKEKLDISLRALNLLNSRGRIPQSQGDHDLYQPAPVYVEGKVTYHF